MAISSWMNGVVSFFCMGVLVCGTKVMARTCCTPRSFMTIMDLARSCSVSPTPIMMPSSVRMPCSLAHSLVFSLVS